MRGIGKILLKVFLVLVLVGSGVALERYILHSDTSEPTASASINLEFPAGKTDQVKIDKQPLTISADSATVSIHATTAEEKGGSTLSLKLIKHYGENKKNPKLREISLENSFLPLIDNTSAGEATLTLVPGLYQVQADKKCTGLVIQVVKKDEDKPKIPETIGKCETKDYLRR